MEKGCHFKQLIYIDGSGFLCEADDGHDKRRAGGEDQEAAEDGRRPEFSASVENGRAQNPDIKDKGQAGLGGARMKRMSWNFSDFRFFGVTMKRITLPHHSLDKEAKRYNLQLVEKH